MNLLICSIREEIVKLASPQNEFATSLTEVRL